MTTPEALQSLCTHTHFLMVEASATTQREYPAELLELFGPELMNDAQEEISRWSGYTVTPLLELEQVAAAAGVASVQYKDESSRFGLGSFKALGGAYAVLRLVAAQLSASCAHPVTMEAIRKGDWKAQAADITVATATDGNHGRSVAWGAQQAGCRCRIYIHREVSVAREAAMAELGATVIRVDGDYDESVRCCAREAANEDWAVVSDTSWPGYQDVPKLVMAGYTAMVKEILAQGGSAPTHVFVQAGVGGLAAAVFAAFWSALGKNAPRFIVGESEYAPCIFKSLSSGSAAHVPIEQETLMAGLSCGETSLIAWEILSRCVSAAITIPDAAVPEAMRCLASGKAVSLEYPLPIEAGECAVPGVIALLATRGDEDKRESLGLDHDSRVLVFGCEGATDPLIYRQLLDARDN